MTVPPLPAEDHRCGGCGFDYDVSPAVALATVEALPAALRRAVDAVPRERLQVRPAPDVWAVSEYVCHLRDVAITSTVRLHRVRTEDRPVLEPMLNDLRARRFRYLLHDPELVLTELGWLVDGLRDEAARVTDWDRVATRLPGEVRTARWLVRNAAHEAQHHLADITAQA